VIWVLLGAKGGDNAQALYLADALNRPFTTKNLVLKPEFETAKPDVEASLHHLDRDRSDPLMPPWPDLVLTIGRRLAMAALWIKARSPSTRVVLIGRPKGKISDFDLVIAPLQYRLPEAENVCRIGLPTLRVASQTLKDAAVKWEQRLSRLPCPLTVLLMGGTTGRRNLTPSMAQSIVSQAREGNAGTLYIATSRRTPQDAIAAIAAALPQNAVLYRWKPDDPDNPYFGLLALGDRFVVTGDSISMLVEVARLGKPLAIAPLTEPRLLDRLVPKKSRDIMSLHEFLYRGGWAVRLGEPFVTPTAPPPDDTENAAARLRLLLPAQD
jgi:mitochondrial fission protein ELM1